MKKPRPGRPFSAEEIAELREIYEHAKRTRSTPQVLDFCRKHDRHRPHVCRKARQLGIQFRPVHGKTDARQAESKERSKQRLIAKERRRREREQQRAWRASPIGEWVAAQQRRADARKAGEAARQKWLAPSDEERTDILAKQMRTKIARYGIVGPQRAERAYTKGVGGLRADLGMYMRSTWEANWARYLNLGIARGIVDSWQYEPRVFTFPDGVDASIKSYTPDFLVRMVDGTEVYHEVKGWMTARSARSLELMREHFAEVPLIVFTRRHYQEVTRRWRDLIAEWERCPCEARRRLARQRADRRQRRRGLS